MVSLFRTRRFLPLFLTQFTGAFNDNFFKSALLMLITFKLGGANSEWLVNVAAGVFILPFFLFSAIAGEISDRFDRAGIARVLKGIELVLMCCLPVLWWVKGTVAFLVFLFLMGTHSAFFGPIKYALLPQELREEELVAGNAYVEAGTYLAILMGTLLGTVLVMKAHGEAMVIGVLIFSGVFGCATSLFIPKVGAANPGLRISPNFLRETWRSIQYVRENRTVFLSILGISWFWLTGAVYLAQFPTLCKVTLNVSDGVVSLFLVVFSVGIGAGSVCCNKLLKGVIAATYVPVACLGMAVFSIAFYVALLLWVPGSETVGVAAFLRSPLAWVMCVVLFCFSFLGGVYTVPLYALMQHRTESGILARVVAGNNILNALFMVTAAVVCALLLRMGLPLPALFLLVGVLTLGVTAVVMRLVPRGLSHIVLRAIFRLFFRMRIEGLERYASVAGEKLIVTPNHVSLLDGFLIAALLPGRIGFAVDEEWMQKWFMKIMSRLIYAVPVSSTNPLAIRMLMSELKSGRTLVIFPEGRITTTGSLMPLHPGAAMLAHKTGAMILPVHIAGAERSVFSYLKGKIKRALFPKITLTVRTATLLTPPAEAKGEELRRALLEQHRTLMSWENASMR